MLVILKFPFFAFRQETLFQLLLVVFITPYKRKNSAAFQKKMKIFSKPENHRLRRLHGLGSSANNKRKARAEERRLPKKQILFLCCLPLEETRHSARLLLRARAT